MKIWVPHLLSSDQMKKRVEIAAQWEQQFAQVEKENVIVIDEKWFFWRSIGTRQTNSVWCTSAADKPKVARRTISDKKSMVLMAVPFGGKLFCEVVTQSIDSEACINCLKNMHQKFSHQANPLSLKNSILIHDNARPHISVKTNEFLQQKRVNLIKQPPYSPNFNLLDRWLFSLLESKRNHIDFLSLSHLN